MAQTKRDEEWDRAAFVAFHAINANPYLRKPIMVNNPYRPAPKPKKVRLEDVDALK